MCVHSLTHRAIVLNELIISVEVSKDLVCYYANRLHRSMKGLGTDEESLTRIMVSRSEIDLENIKECFKKKYSKTLYSFIKVRP